MAEGRPPRPPPVRVSTGPGAGPGERPLARRRARPGRRTAGAAMAGRLGGGGRCSDHHPPRRHLDRPVPVPQPRPTRRRRPCLGGREPSAGCGGHRCASAIWSSPNRSTVATPPSSTTTTVAAAPSTPVDAVPATDALVTASPAAVLVTLVADCVPIVLFDPAARVLATVHAGWRGTATGVVAAALDAMARPRCGPATVVPLGPSVSPDTYRWPTRSRRAFERCSAAGRGLARPGGPGAGWSTCAGQPAHAGPRRGTPAPRCLEATTGGPGPFFSDRAARPCGRFALLARLRP